MRTRSIKEAVLLALAALVWGVGVVAAQTESGALAQQSLRSYWHVFIAFALAWLFVAGWLVSMARKLTRVERQLDE